MLGAHDKPLVRSKLTRGFVLKLFKRAELAQACDLSIAHLSSDINLGSCLANSHIC